jgi:uncharacterized protein
MMMVRKIGQHELCGRSPPHRRRLAWIAAAATVNAHYSYGHIITAEAAAASAFLTAPRRSHYHHHLCDPLVLAGREGSVSASSCVGSRLAMISTCSTGRRRRHAVSPRKCPHPLQQQQQPALRISTCRWMTANAISDEENRGANKDYPRHRDKQRKNTSKQPKISKKESVAAATPLTKSAQELAEDAENREIENAARNWLEQIVIGLNLCPFAERPVRTNKLRIHVVRGNDEHVLLSSMLCALFLQKEQLGTTTLVVCPECHANDFTEYLNVLNKMEALLEEHDLTGVLQIAPFHPLFEFEGSSSSSSSSVHVDNYTNRAPYPIFHILREDEVERAVEMLQGDAGRVWKRNVRLLETMHKELGAQDFEQVMKPCCPSTAGAGIIGNTVTTASSNTTTTAATMAQPPPRPQNDATGDLKEKVRAILRRHRIQLSRSSLPSLSPDSYDDKDDDVDDSRNEAP